jgi:hypothetical protein
MGYLAALFATFSGLSLILSFVTALQVYSEPIFSDKFTWPFWMGLSMLFLLATIACILVKRNSHIND